MIDLTRETAISLVEVARRLGVTVQTVRNWTERNERPLEKVKLGGKVVTSWEAVNRFGRQSQKKPPAKQRERRVNDAAEKYLQEIGI